MPSYLDFLFPPQCLLCQADTGSGQGLCPDCWGQFRYATGLHCQYCARPLTHHNRQLHQEKAICGACLSQKPIIDHVFALSHYQDTARELILRLKHQDQLHIGKFLARLSYQRYADWIDKADMLIPVPLHWQRRLQRKTNQSAEIARHLGKLSGGQHSPHYVRRKYKTPQMKGMNRQQRDQTVKAVFEIPRQYRSCLQGQHILLIDDVMTSGATLNRLAQKFKQQTDVASVSALVMAKVIL